MTRCFATPGTPQTCSRLVQLQAEFEPGHQLLHRALIRDGSHILTRACNECPQEANFKSKIKFIFLIFGC